MPLSLEEIAGEREAASFGVYHVHREDTFYVNWNGAGGVRDPLDRDPHAVERDMAEGVVSVTAARQLYGVVVLDDGVIDHEATAALRNTMRRERLTCNAQPITDARVCRRCGANGDENAQTVRVRERLLSEIDGCYTSGPKTMLAELVCIRCGGSLDAEVTLMGAKPLFDGAQIRTMGE
jgi:hypothetical protein